MNWNLTKNKDIKEVRLFGFIALILFGCLCVLGVLTRKPIPAYLFGFLSIMGLGFIIMPSELKPVHTVWLKCAHLIGRIVTTLILSLAYYLVITPVALIKRLFGGTPLPLKPNKETSSYWVDRGEPSQPKERFLKRY